MPKQDDKAKGRKVPKRLIEDLNVFLSLGDQGDALIEGLAKDHLSGVDIIPSFDRLSGFRWFRSIAFLIGADNQTVEDVLSSTDIRSDAREKLRQVRLKYRPILEDVFDEARDRFLHALIDPISLLRVKPRYLAGEQRLVLEVEAWSAQKLVFRIVDTVSSTMWLIDGLITDCNEWLSWCQDRGLPLSKYEIRRLKTLESTLKQQVETLAKIVEQYPAAEKELEEVAEEVEEQTEQ